MMDENKLIGQLNKEQYVAVTAPLGNLLVLAGAGSGKTRVLIYRILWLLQQTQEKTIGIFAVTFTNKAANEMKHRLQHFYPNLSSNIWIGTFHGLAHKLLRIHYHKCNLNSNFQILDSEDQLRLIKRSYKALNVSEDHEPKATQSYINRNKDMGIRANKLGPPESGYEQIMQEVYRHYEDSCKNMGYVDFAELLLKAFELLDANHDLLEQYHAKFQHFLVDEFQDTNTIQYKWLKLLAQQAQSVTMVGDDDQSIYAWRGAKVENIENFQQDFAPVNTVRLEQNYRSTSIILQAANALIDNNSKRIGKTLWTEADQGNKIVLYPALNEEDESLFICRQIEKIIQQQKFSLEDIAVLYRSNAQSRVLEESLLRAGLPYSIYGGVRFFERAEIKDALSYLRLALNHHDNAAFERVINTPPRGLGQRSLSLIYACAIEQNCSYWQASQLVLQDNKLTSKAMLGIKQLNNLLSWINENQDINNISELIEAAVVQSGLLAYFQQQRGEKAQMRCENLQELLNAADRFYLEDDVQSSKLMSFLAYASLEQNETHDKKTAVQLMTLHAAKGLEFPVVFICGMEENLFPNYFSADSAKNVEEERRLCYVGITRAKQCLYFSFAQRRRVFGREESRKVSRFLDEIPQELIDHSYQQRVHTARPHHFQVPISTPVQKTRNSKVLVKSIEGFSLGQRVKHFKFGYGVVLDIEGSGARARVCVDFELSGNKWLILSYAKLEPVY